MSKIYLFILLAIVTQLFSNNSIGQVLQEPGKGRRCFAAESLEQAIKDNPRAETVPQFEQWIRSKITERKSVDGSQARINPTVTIPVIFHIIHNGEAVGTGYNISQEAIRQQILQLNKDFANLSGSTYAVAEDMGIRFALAQNDTFGVRLAEPGIDRINRNDKRWSAPPYGVGYAAPNYLNATIKPNSIWDPARYLNVWIADLESDILGVATFPGSSMLDGLNNTETNSNAGIAVSYTSVGSVFAPQSCGNAVGKGRTLTHEMGHFFGLRHIWGDADCGTDYVDDTPVHFASNAGQPSHPKRNSCGTEDEMFENYMDYTDDIVTNTFTINQGDRMEAVFANSPRRNSLTASNAGNVLVTGSNRIAFADCDGAMSVPETGITNTCPRYRDVNLVLNVEDHATGAAIITVTTAGTAIAGVDYLLRTPTVRFNDGDNYQLITLRIFDNAVVNGNRNIVVSYSIDGAGVTAAASAQTLTVTITDDDFNMPINEATPSTVILLNENFGTTTGSNQLPAGWASRNSGSATNKWVVNSAGAATYGFTGNTAHISNGTTAAVAAGTAAIAYSTSVNTDARLETPQINATGLKNIKVSFDYVSNGERDLDQGIVYYSTNGNNYTALNDQFGNLKVFERTAARSSVELTLPPAANGAPTLTLMFRWINDNSSGAAPPFTIDNVVVKGEKQTIETQLNHAATANIAAATDNYLYSSNDGQMIVRINNASDSLGCVTATVTQAGNGRIVVNTSSGSYFRSGKVIQIKPATGRPNTTWQGTLYFTAGELSPAWSNTEIPNLKILKVKDGVSLTGVITSNDAELITPTFTANADNGYYTYTGNFTGFSQLILVSQTFTLPVHLLTFGAAAQQNNILLTWTTGQELDNSGFNIERSTDGNNFTEIGKVQGAGTTANRTDYSYTDRNVQPGITYYYRLRQVDMNNHNRLSDVRKAKIDQSGIAVRVAPNPATDKVNLLITGTTAKADVRLIGSQGQVVRQWSGINANNAGATLNVQGLATGIYVLDITIGNEKTTQKLIIRSSR